MGKKSYTIVLLLAAAAGFVGGGISNRLLGERAEVPEDQVLKRVVVANEVHLVDEEGRDRWVLALSKKGEPSVTFVNKKGWAPMAMGINEDGSPFFNMVLEPEGRGGAYVTLMDSTMKGRALLALNEDGEPHLTLLDRNGRVRATLGSTVIEDPITGAQVNRPCSSLVLFDERGRIIWSAPGLFTRPIQFSKKSMQASDY